MRRLALVVAIALASCAAPRTGSPAQTGAMPTRASPTPVAQPVRYVAVGASDGVGVGAGDPRTGSWPARLAARLPAGSSLLNVGVSGSLAAQAAREQLPLAIRARPTLVTVWLAVNDLVARLSAEQYARDLASVIDPLVELTEARVFVGTVPDLRAVPAFADADPQALAAFVAAYNGAIARVASRHEGRVGVVDLSTGSADLTTSSTVAADGFHPSDRGYELIADRFATAIRAAGYAVR